MDDNGDGSSWIYLAFIILSAVVGLFKSKTTKQTARNDQPKTPGSQSPWNFGEEEDMPEVPEVPVVPIEMVRTDSVRSSASCRKEEADFLPGEAYYKRNTTNGSSMETETRTQETEEDNHEGVEFDPVKAVIYSEILKRKFE